MQRLLFHVGMIGIIACLGVSVSLAQQAESSDEVAIRDIMQKYEQGWKLPNAQEIYQEVLSDTSLVSARLDPQNPSQAIVMNKQAALEFLKTLPKLPEYDFQIRAIQIAGALAYVVGVDKMKAPDGSDFNMETIHFLAKESAGWKVLFGTLAGPVRQSFGMKPMPQDRYAEYFKPPQELSSDETAIRDIIAKIDSAWKMDTPSKVFQGIISDQAFALAATRPGDPSQLVLFTKESYCQFRDDRAQDFQHQTYSQQLNAIQIFGPLACQYGTLTVQTSSGNEIKQEMVGFYAKEQKGWKLIFGAEAPNVRNVLQDADKKKPIMSGDEKNLRRISQRFVDVFSLENPTPFEWLEEILTEDFFVVLSDGKMLPDKQITLQEYRKVLDAICKGASSMKMNFDIHSVRVFKETACVFGKIRMEGQAKKSSEAFQRHIWETLLFRRVNGQWKIDQEHSTRAHIKPERQ